MDQPNHSLQISPATGAANHDDAFERIEAVDTLQPGFYWRVRTPVGAVDDDWQREVNLRAGDVLLLLDVTEFEGAAQSVKLLCHPRQGSRTTYRLLIADFLANMEPAPEGEEVREREIAALMGEVAALQQEMLTAQSNPLALPGVKEAVEKAVEQFEQDAVRDAQQNEQDQRKRSQDIGRIMRRAARRSAAAGNPLAVRSTTISDNVEVMLAGGIDSEGLKELTLEARRRVAMATATSAWLTARSKRVGEKMEALAPYYAEKGRVALARADKVVRYVKRLTQGLTSLKLYTGDGVDVLTVAQGESASTGEPLTLVQGKKFVDEEFAVWADVGEHFDWRSVPLFLEALSKNSSLMDQVFPTARCVVAMATTRRDIDYGSKEPLQAALDAIENKRVFLLARDGANVHVIYSSEPSHEVAPRLFPNKAEVDEIFAGVDGSRIGLQDVAFAKAMEQHELLKVSYLRLLVLLCGLDHRLKLFGEFYPPEQGLSFMRQEFQDKYFRFLADDEEHLQLADDLPPVRDWLKRCNESVQSGSRVVLLETALSSYSPLIKRIYGLEVDSTSLPPVSVASREGKRHYVSVPVTTRSGRHDTYSSATVYLDREEGGNADWFLCVDKVRLEDLRRYIYSRRSRAGDISWLRAFKRAVQVLEHDLQQEAPLREHLRRVALEHQVMAPAEVDGAIAEAVATWRAAHRGAAAPQVEDTKQVNAILSLIFPADRLAQAASSQVDALVEELGLAPLRLVRTGKNKLALYVETIPDDREPYAGGVAWGWVKRFNLEATRSAFRLGTSRLVWLQKGREDPTEQVVRSWPAADRWLHESGEPVRLADLAAMKQRMADACALLPVLQGGAERTLSAAIPDELYSALRGRADRIYREASSLPGVWVAVPIGVGRRTAAEDAEFLYAAMTLPAFLFRYGSEQQWRAFHSDSPAAAYYDIRERRKTGLPTAHWHLVAMSRPAAHLVCLNDAFNSKLPFLSIESHERGSGRRKFVDLSFDRALAAARGIDPIRRRAFNKDLKHRLWRVASHFDPEEVRKERRRAEAARKWSPSFEPWELSPLVWDEQGGRARANALFAVSPERDARAQQPRLSPEHAEDCAEVQEICRPGP